MWRWAGLPEGKHAEIRRCVPVSHLNVFNLSANCRRGEIVENTEPLGLGMPLLLVKPSEGLATPAIFKA